MKFFKHTNILLMFLVLAVFLVSGPQGCPSSGSSSTSSVVSEGVGVSFVDNAPPLSVGVNQEFPIYLEVLNKGGDFVKLGDAKFYLTGVGPNLEGVKSSQVNDRALSKESVSPDRISFADAAKFTFPIESLYTLPLSLTSCYSYGTRTEASVCVSARNESSVCKMGDEKITSKSNSVAPVQISSFKEEKIGNKLRVLFNIENKLDGKVYLPDTNCDNLQAKEMQESFKKDKVAVEVRFLDSGFSCNFLNEDSSLKSSLKGNTKLGKVVCEKVLEGNENYKAPFSIITRYKYVQSTFKNINIVP